MFRKGEFKFLRISLINDRHAATFGYRAYMVHSPIWSETLFCEYWGFGAPRGSTTHNVMFQLFKLDLFDPLSNPLDPYGYPHWYTGGIHMSTWCLPMVPNGVTRPR